MVQQFEFLITTEKSGTIPKWYPKRPKQGPKSRPKADQ